MNSDEIMSDPAGLMKTTSPSDSQSQQQQSKTAAAWNTKKFREEYEMYKNRLQDQRFSVGMSCDDFISHLTRSGPSQSC